MQRVLSAALPLGLPFILLRHDLGLSAHPSSLRSNAYPRDKEPSPDADAADGKRGDDRVEGGGIDANANHERDVGGGTLSNKRP